MCSNKVYCEIQQFIIIIIIFYFQVPICLPVVFTDVLKYSIFLIFKLRTNFLASYEKLGLFVTIVSATLLENLTDDAIA